MIFHIVHTAEQKCEVNMSDLIEREAVLDALCSTCGDGGKNCPLRPYCEVAGVIEEVPSTEPEQKVGHWVYKDGARGFGIGAWCCSECGEENESLPFHKCKDPYAYVASRYCACCGAKMEAGHETD